MGEESQRGDGQAKKERERDGTRDEGARVFEVAGFCFRWPQPSNQPVKMRGAGGNDRREDDGWRPCWSKLKSGCGVLFGWLAFCKPLG